MLWSNVFKIIVMQNPKHIYSNIKKNHLYVGGEGGGEVATKIVAYKEFNIKLGNG
jgi:hypothetical protein